MRARQTVVARFAKTSASLLALVFLTGCASLTSTSSNQLVQQIAQADAAYRSLGADRVSGYNNAVASIARQIDGKTPNELRSELAAAGVRLDQPHISLSLARYHLVPRLGIPNESGEVGVPVLLEYDTTNAPLYPRDGLMVSATAVYRRVEGEPHLSLLSWKDSIKLDGMRYALEVDNVAPITAMARRGQHVARAGFRYMIRGASMNEKAGVYLIEPYDPKKVIVLMVPGLQSTPFAFVDLLKAMGRDPELTADCQVWTFLYGTGTPVLLNALELRRDLEKTIREVDPHDHDFATHHIVVLGHSMGGLLAHTLVSSSGEKLWSALFEVSPEKMHGDPATVRRFSAAFHFRRNPRVIRAIFAATPHRGSKLAESWIGRIAASLIRLPLDVKSEIADVVSGNRDVSTAAAQAFNRGMNFSAVATLSPRDPALQALADLPLEVPFHSIIGQKHAGEIETSSDSVVGYHSSHLDGATSELVVRSGHSVCNNPDAQREIIRILRLQLLRNAVVARR